MKKLGYVFELENKQVVHIGGVPVEIQEPVKVFTATDLERVLNEPNHGERNHVVENPPTN